MEFRDSCYISKLQKPFNILFEIAQEIEFMLPAAHYIHLQQCLVMTKPQEKTNQNTFSYKVFTARF